MTDSCSKFIIAGTYTASGELKVSRRYISDDDDRGDLSATEVVQKGKFEVAWVCPVCIKRCT